MSAPESVVGIREHGFENAVVINLDHVTDADLTPLLAMGTIANVRAVLASLLRPPPVWTDGDVVQHESGNYTAQRANGAWHTTTSRSSDPWREDAYVTNHVLAGRLNVLRQQVQA